MLRSSLVTAVLVAALAVPALAARDGGDRQNRRGGNDRPARQVQRDSGAREARQAQNARAARPQRSVAESRVRDQPTNRGRIATIERRPQVQSDRAARNERIQRPTRPTVERAPRPAVQRSAERADRSVRHAAPRAERPTVERNPAERPRVERHRIERPNQPHVQPMQRAQPNRVEQTDVGPRMSDGRFRAERRDQPRAQADRPAVQRAPRDDARAGNGTIDRIQPRTVRPTDDVQHRPYGPQERRRGDLINERELTRERDAVTGVPRSHQRVTVERPIRDREDRRGHVRETRITDRPGPAPVGSGSLRAVEPAHRITGDDIARARRDLRTRDWDRGRRHYRDYDRHRDWDNDFRVRIGFSYTSGYRYRNYFGHRGYYDYNDYCSPVIYRPVLYRPVYYYRPAWHRPVYYGPPVIYSSYVCPPVVYSYPCYAPGLSVVFDF